MHSDFDEITFVNNKNDRRQIIYVLSGMMYLKHGNCVRKLCFSKVIVMNFKMYNIWVGGGSVSQEQVHYRSGDPETTPGTEVEPCCADNSAH